MKSDIRPEDTAELGGQTGLFALPPTMGLSMESATDFHATLNSWPKSKARKAVTPPNGETARVTEKSPSEQLSNLVDQTDKNVAFLEKVCRTCKTDADAQTVVGQCKEINAQLLDLLERMQRAQREVANADGAVSAEYVQWAKAALAEPTNWIEKNRKICQHYINSVVPKSSKRKKKDSPKDPAVAT